MNEDILTLALSVTMGLVIVWALRPRIYTMDTRGTQRRFAERTRDDDWKDIDDR